MMYFVLFLKNSLFELHLKTSSHLKVYSSNIDGSLADIGIKSTFKSEGNIMQSVIVIGLIAALKTSGLQGSRSILKVSVLEL